MVYMGQEDQESVSDFFQEEFRREFFEEDFNEDIDIRQEQRTHEIYIKTMGNQDDISTSVPDLSRKRVQIPPFLEAEENYTTYIPNLNRDIIRGPLIGILKKEEKRFGQAG
ncbi:hypothetical protein JTB14_027495 [Gonioctena quinquepunctata]|nr:hypothetical protein JTB14_027495 [Gonioctena quinquepunctata]